MKKLLMVLVQVVMLVAARSTAFAQIGWVAWYPYGGSEALRVVASNQAMIWSLAQPFVGYPGPQYPQTVLQQQPRAQAQEPALIVVSPQPRLAGVEFRVKNNSRSTVTVVTLDGRRLVLGPGAMGRVRTPDVQVFILQADGKGSFDEFEIDLRGTEDASLPGWVIRDALRLKRP